MLFCRFGCFVLFSFPILESVKFFQVSKISSRAFEKLTGLKPGSRGPGEWPDAGKEPQALPLHCPEHTGSAPQRHPSTCGASPPAGPGVGSQPTQQRDRMPFGMLIAALSKRVQGQGGNKACLYAARPFSSWRAWAPWEPPGSLLNPSPSWQNRHPQTEGRVDITKMRGGISTICPSVGT